MSDEDKPPSLTDLLVARAIYDLAGDWVTRGLICVAVVIAAGALAFAAWALFWALSAMPR
jgi:hypothetical protein